VVKKEPEALKICTRTYRSLNAFGNRQDHKGQNPAL